MDTFELKARKVIESHFKGTVVDLYINGVNLIDTLTVFETKMVEQTNDSAMPGHYMGLDPQELYQNLMNPEKYSWDDKHRSLVLGCVCGDEGCWPMHVDVRKKRDHIIWTDFENRFRNGEFDIVWDYSEIGPFVFDRKAYEEQLEWLRKKFNCTLP